MSQDSFYMGRKIENAIRAWFKRGDTHPLLIRGARRTGKTSAIEHVGKALAGEGFVKLDFQTDLENIERIFDGPTDDLNRIASRIAEYKRLSLDP